MASKGKKQAATTASEQQQQTIDITQLPVPQLQQFAQTLDQELEFLQQSMQQLKEAQGKFITSQDALRSVTSSNSGKDVLVPLTSSLYVAGQLSDDNRVLVDIGTGYYVEKTISEASLYFKRKIDFITKQIEKVQPVMQEKFNMKQVAVEILQQKMASQQQAQKAQS